MLNIFIKPIIKWCKYNILKDIDFEGIKYENNVYLNKLRLHNWMYVIDGNLFNINIMKIWFIWISKIERKKLWTIVHIKTRSFIW